MANVGEEEGVIEEDENKIIRNVMRLNEVKAYEIMTPRVVAAIASEKMTLREYYDSDAYDHFSRIPVYADSPEFITGYVLRGDALEELTEDQFQKTLGEIKRSLLYFNEEMNVGDIFDAMLKEKSQIGVVIDDYGCLQGIITFEDVIETIFGLEIIDEMDVVTDMQQYARERWQLRQKRFKPVVMRSNDTLSDSDSLNEDSVSHSILTEEA
jgi:CBS domain containing-hemolysin-like protein